jgi:tight adherence protein B
VTAFTVAAAESGGQTARSLRAVASRARLGADVAEGMRVMARNSAVPDHWNRLAVFWDLAAAHGLALSTLMRAAQRDIVERQRFADRMNAALAGARATAAILAALPALGVLLGQMIGADPVRFLLGDGVGGVLLGIGAGLICLGVTWADRIVDRLVT